MTPDYPSIADGGTHRGHMLIATTDGLYCRNCDRPVTEDEMS